MFPTPAVGPSLHRGPGRAKPGRRSRVLESPGVRDWIMLIVGTVLGVIALTADLIGIGGYPGFGWKQAALTVVAVLIVTFSAIRIVSRDRRSR
jgi:hypothetical protein